MRIFSDANYDFLSWRRAAYRVTAVLLALALAAFAVGSFRAGSWVNYGVDFTGGTLVQIHFDEPTNVAELRALLGPSLPGSEITRFGGANEFLVRAPTFGEGGREVTTIVTASLGERFADGQYQIVRTEAVGPKIGEELQQRALLAITLAFALTMIYLAIRFEWRFGVAAVIAAIHDILITLGIISLLRLEVSLPTVAAVLTVIGYSLNDTIVVFDRIRENLKKLGRKETYKHVVNRSINDVLPRTVITSGTTLAALLALYLLGGAIIRDFALILIVGILVGTYSSIFIASPILLEVQARWGDKKTARAAAATRGETSSSRQRAAV